MKLVKLFGVLVAVAGVAVLAVAAGSFEPRAQAQGRLLAERPFDSQQRDDRPERRAHEFTVLSGRGAEIGVRVADGSSGGVVIEEVQPDSAAEKAGLKRSDVIVEFDGEHVRSARQFGRLVQETPSGRTVKATITREGQKKDVQITPTEGRAATMMFDGGRMTERLGDLAGRLPNFNFDFDFPGMFSGDFPGMLSGRRLGISVDELTHQLAEFFGAKDGVLVTAVTDGSAAARAGLKAGDVITSINGASVTSRDDLVRGLRDASEDVSIGIVRDKKESTLTAKIEPPTRRTPRGRPA